MKSEKEKMLAGELYNASDPELTKERLKVRKLLHQYNHSDPADLDRRKKLLIEMIGLLGSNVYIEPPFYCDYGYNIILGENVYFNFDCVVLDVNKVEIGANTLIGPGVHIYTATHTLSKEERQKGLEYAIPVTIGNDVWLGGGVIVCPGVTVGSGSVIGAGSIVTRSIPSDVFAAGNPCRVIRSI